MGKRLRWGAGLACSALLALGGTAALQSCASVPRAPPPGVVRSQLGTVPDGLARSVHGTLLIDDALRRRFDYYLAGIDERPLVALVAAAEADLEQHLTADVAATAKRLFQQYVAYKQALGTLKQDANLQGNSLAAARARLAAVRALRPQFFSREEAAGLFGWQDAYDDDALARLEIAQDSRLDAAEKMKRLAMLNANAPPEIVAEREAPVRFLALRQQVRDARARGATEDEVFRLRAANVGDEAATRLAALDREESAWKQRIDAYKLDRTAILADKSLDDTTRETALQALRDARFSAQEQKRLAAYE